MAGDLDPRRVGRFLRELDAGSRVLLDALTDEIAVIDRTGRIVGVNEAWLRFARENGAPDAAKTGVGQNYLAECERAAAAGEQDAGEALVGIRGVLRGASSQFSLQYSCDSPWEQRWFSLTASPLAQGQGAVIAHRDVTVLRKAQDVLRLSGEVPATALSDLVLSALVKNLALALNVRHAFLSELADPAGAKLRLLAHWSDGTEGDLFEYDIAGTPCEGIRADRPCLIPSDLQLMFPGDSWLKQIGADSFLAISLVDAQEKRLGFMGVIDTKPIRDASFPEAALRIFAARAVPELERRRMERHLAHQAGLIEHAPDAIIGSDQDFVITAWNRAAERTYGWTADEVLGRRLQDVLQSDLPAGQTPEASKSAADTDEFFGEVTQRRKDGTPVEIETTTMAFRDDAGCITGFVSINRDITWRKQAEEGLKKAELENNAILEAIPDMMFALDSSGTFLSFKPAQHLEPLVPPSTFLGKSVEDVLPPDIAPQIMDAIEATLKSGQTQTINYALQEDDLTKEYEARIVPTSSNEVLAIVRDYTAQRQQKREEARRLEVEELEGKVERQMIRRNPYQLTFRELTVLNLIASGLADKEIADRLGLSIFTVNKHVTNILGKMNVASRTLAAVRAHREEMLA